MRIFYEIVRKKFSSREERLIIGHKSREQFFWLNALSGLIIESNFFFIFMLIYVRAHNKAIKKI